MSLNNDYTIQLLSRQRHSELMAEAANDRLASLALSGRPTWRQRHSRLATTKRRFAVVSTHLG